MEYSFIWNMYLSGDIESLKKEATAVNRMISNHGHCWSCEEIEEMREVKEKLYLINAILSEMKN